MNAVHTVDTKQALQILDVLTRDVTSEQRAASYYTINACQLLGLVIGKGEEAWDALSPMAKQDNISAFLFITRAPFETVARAVRFFARLRDDRDEAGRPVRSGDEAWDEFAIKYLDPFLAEISPDAMIEAFEEIAKLGEHVPVVAVPPAHQKSEGNDPNA